MKIMDRMNKSYKIIKTSKELSIVQLAITNNISIKYARELAILISEYYNDIVYDKEKQKLIYRENNL